MKRRTQFKLIILGILLIPVVAYAATVSRVTTFSDGSILTAAQLNAEFDNVVDNMNALTNDNISTSAAISPAKISSAIKGSSITRNASTGALSVNVDDSSIEISSDALQLKDAGIATAKIADNAVTRAKIAVIDQIPAGSVMQFHTFNGAVDIPRGWMKLNGDVVNQTNYDAIHGAGTYTTDGIASSALLSKNLPDMDTHYATGSDTTTQDGSVAITTVGNAGNQINLQHSHTEGNLAAHMSANIPGTVMKYEIVSGVRTHTTTRSFPATVTSSSTSGETFGIATSGTTDTALSTTQSIRPDSVEFIFIMKVI